VGCAQRTRAFARNSWEIPSEEIRDTPGNSLENMFHTQASFRAHRNIADVEIGRQEASPAFMRIVTLKLGASKGNGDGKENSLMHTAQIFPAGGRITKQRITRPPAPIEIFSNLPQQAKTTNIRGNVNYKLLLLSLNAKGSILKTDCALSWWKRSNCCVDTSKKVRPILLALCVCL